MFNIFSLIYLFGIGFRVIMIRRKEVIRVRERKGRDLE